MGKGSEKRAVRKRVADVSADERDIAEKLKRATARRIAKLEKDLAAAHKTAERHRSRLAEASAEADHIRKEIAGLLRHASEPAVGGARKVGHAASDLIEDAADAVADAAGGVMHAAVSVVEAARRSMKAKPATPPRPAKATPPKPAEAATPRSTRARKATPPAAGPSDG